MLLQSTSHRTGSHTPSEGLACFPHAVLKWTLCSSVGSGSSQEAKPFQSLQSLTGRARILSFIHRPKPFPLLSAHSNKHLSCGCLRTLSSLLVLFLLQHYIGSVRVRALGGRYLHGGRPAPGKESTPVQEQELSWSSSRWERVKRSSVISESLCFAVRVGVKDFFPSTFVK